MPLAFCFLPQSRTAHFHAFVLTHSGTPHITLPWAFSPLIQFYAEAGNQVAAKPPPPPRLILANSFGSFREPLIRDWTENWLSHKLACNFYPVNICHILLGELVWCAYLSPLAFKMHEHLTRFVERAPVDCFLDCMPCPTLTAPTSISVALKANGWDLWI